MSSIFNLPQFKSYSKQWEARQAELITRAGYYDGSIYKKARDQFWTLGAQVNGKIRPLFLPFARAVDVDAGIIGSGWEFPEDDPKAEVWCQARDVLFDNSDWDTQGVLFIHYGAMYGVSGLRVSDSPIVTIVPADPTRFMLVYSGVYNKEPVMCLWVEKRLDDDGKEYEYAEVITDTTISTYKAGELFGYDGRDPMYENTIGKVPVFECLHINDGTPLGECTYQKAVVLLNELNDMASRLLEIIKRHADPQTVITGAEPSDLQRGSDIAWFLPAGADAQFVASAIDIPGVLSFIQEIKTGVHDALPELSFDELKKAGQVATATLELQLMELVIKIKRCRPNYDRALVYAMQLAGVAAKQIGDASISPLDDPELILDAHRNILPDSEMDEVQLEKARWDTVNAAVNNGNGIPLETALIEIMDWQPKQLTNLGVQKAAAILNAQEDIAPVDPATNQPMSQ